MVLQIMEKRKAEKAEGGASKKPKLKD